METRKKEWIVEAKAPINATIPSRWTKRKYRKSRNRFSTTRADWSSYLQRKQKIKKSAGHKSWRFTRLMTIGGWSWRNPRVLMANWTTSCRNSTSLKSKSIWTNRSLKWLMRNRVKSPRSTTLTWRISRPWFRKSYKSNNKSRIIRICKSFTPKIVQAASSAWLTRSRTKCSELIRDKNSSTFPIKTRMLRKTRLSAMRR